MDNNAVQSRTAMSSIESSEHVLDFPETASKSTNHQEFVNHGLTVWNQTRQHWVRNERRHTQCQIREPRISWSATYESLLGTKKPFRKPIPLFEMVDFLVDIWEEEGLYDDS